MAPPSKPRKIAPQVVDPSASSTSKPKAKDLIAAYRSYLIIGLAVVVLAVAWLQFGPRKERPIFALPTMKGVFSHKGTGNDLADWTKWLKEAQRDTTPYPSKKYSGKGIVSAITFGQKYLSCLYITLKVIREHVHSKLPIEVFYYARDPVPTQILQHLQSTFSNVKFLDLQKIPGLPSDLSLNGYQVKAFSIVFSSFEEVFFLDSDSMPLLDPAILFDVPDYKRTGALFWPDICNMHSARPEAWGVFSLPNPASWPQSDTITTNHAFSFAYNATSAWTDTCTAADPLEVGAGEIVINKRKTWPALLLTLFINRNHHFFNKRLMAGDKQSFIFSFNVTNIPYAVSKLPVGVGLVTETHKGVYFGANTMGQRHPVTGEIMFLHRNQAKFSNTHDYLLVHPTPRAWTHVARQGRSSSWPVKFRDTSPPELFIAPSQEAILHPIGMDVIIRPVGPEVKRLEDKCIEYLQELSQLPYYPSNVDDCDGDKQYLCSHE